VIARTVCTPVVRAGMLRARRGWVKGRGAADWKYSNCRGAGVEGCWKHSSLRGADVRCAVRTFDARGDRHPGPTAARGGTSHQSIGDISAVT
jgi:hypothetical protein